MHPQTQLTRCFIQPIEKKPDDKRGKGKRGMIRKRKGRRTWRDEIPLEMIALLRPWAHPYLVFDTETGAQSGQQAKIIFWQERGLRYADRCSLFADGTLTTGVMDECWRQGVAYNPLTCSPEEIETVNAYAIKHDLWCRDMDWFINSVLYRRAMLNRYMPEPKMILGHNLPFDLGTLSNRTAKSRDKEFYGALSIGMCRCFERPEKEQRCGGTDTREEFRACEYHPYPRQETRAWKAYDEMRSQVQWA